MSKNYKGIRETYFTIITPKKDGSILDQFLEEFGYSPFETEERDVDTRRSVKQISKNEELKEEVADFCKEHGCSITLVYKERGKLNQQLFKGKQMCKAKPYEKEDLNLPEDTIVERPQARRHNNNNSSNNNSNNNKNNRPNQSKNTHHNKNRHKPNPANRFKENDRLDPFAEPKEPKKEEKKVQVRTKRRRTMGSSRP